MKNKNPVLVEIFDENASRMSSRLGVREKGKDWDYDELLARSEGLSDYLVSLGINRGQRIVLLLPNSGVFVTSFFGVLRTGGIVVPFNTHFRKQELELYLADLSPSVIIVSDETSQLATETVLGMEPSPILLEMKSDGAFRGLRGGETREAVKTEQSDPPALLQFTSGSTGEPKRILRTHGQLLFELERLAKKFSLGEFERFLGVAPFSHVNGLVRTMLMSMYAGGTLYPMESFNRRETLKIISQERITYFGGVPYIFIALASTPPRGVVNLSSIRIAFSSSAPFLPDDNHAFQEKYGFFIRQLYGSTETGTISVNTDVDIKNSLESVGLPLEGIKLAVFDDGGKALPPYQEGEIGIASPGAIPFYENNPKANAESFREGFYLSGDLGFKDSEGRLSLTGRKKFLINRGGYEVNPFETERAIKSHPKVEEVVVFGVPTRHGDQSIKCLIVPNSPVMEQEIIDHCRSLLSDFKVPGTIEFVKSLPKS